MVQKDSESADFKLANHLKDNKSKLTVPHAPAGNPRTDSSTFSSCIIFPR